MMKAKQKAVTDSRTVASVKRITKHYDKLAQAEAYQQRLYGKFDSVQLVGFPRFSNHGNYTWEVR